MKITISEHTGEGELNFNVEQVEQFMPVPKDTADRLRSTTVNSKIWNEIRSNRYLLFPYCGASAKDIAEIQIEAPENDDTGTKMGEGGSCVRHMTTEVRSKIMRRFCSTAAVYTDIEFYLARHSPAWIAMLLKGNPAFNDPVQEQLKTSHVLVASLLASQVEKRPLRQVVGSARQINKTELQPKIFVDGLGRKFPEYKKDASKKDGFARDEQGQLIPEMQRAVIGTDWDNQYWQTTDSSSPMDKSDRIIVGDTILSGNLLTRTETFAGHAQKAEGFIIPV